MNESNESAKRFPSEEREKGLLTERRRPGVPPASVPSKLQLTQKVAKVVGKAVNEETSGVSMYSYTPCGTPIELAVIVERVVFSGHSFPYYVIPDLPLPVRYIIPWRERRFASSTSGVPVAGREFREKGWWVHWGCYRSSS